MDCESMPAARPHLELHGNPPEPARPHSVDASAPYHRHASEDRATPPLIERPRDRRDAAEVAGFVTMSLLRHAPDTADSTSELAGWAMDEVLITRTTLGARVALGETTWFEVICVDLAPRPGAVVAKVAVEEVTAGEGTTELVVRSVIATLVEDAGGWHVASLEWAR